MTVEIRRRDTCRLCDGPQPQLVLQLTPTPPANAFVPRERRCEPQPVFPLDVYLCRHCGHAQLLDVVHPEILFGNYVYVSGTSPVFVEHFRGYAADVAGMVDVGPKPLALDIGSNDGTMLRFLQQAGFCVLGIDPARTIAATATAAGIETQAAFFTESLARSIRAERGTATVITANNVFAHIDDLGDVTRGVAHLLDPNGVFVFEVSYLLDVLEKTLFDTIYHEHLSYHAIKPLIGFFHRHGLKLFDVRRVSSHGGSVRCFVCPQASGRRVSSRVAALIADEERRDLFEPDTYRGFAAGIDTIRCDLSRLLQSIAGGGERMAGYGAPAKATTLLYHFGLTTALEYIVDDSPLKQNLFTPGAHIPVLPSSAILENRPDYLLILAWNFAEPIMAKCHAYRDGGGRFIVPLPRCEVY